MRNGDAVFAFLVLAAVVLLLAAGLAKVGDWWEQR